MPAHEAKPLSAPHVAPHPLLSQLDTPAYIAGWSGQQLVFLSVNDTLTTLLSRPVDALVNRPVRDLLSFLPPASRNQPASRQTHPCHSGLLRHKGHTLWVDVREYPIAGAVRQRLGTLHVVPIDASSLCISGDAPRSLELIQDLVRAAARPTPCVLIGEPHTGKTQLAVFLATRITGSSEGVIAVSGKSAARNPLNHIPSDTSVVVFTDLHETSSEVQDQLVQAIQRSGPYRRWVFTSDHEPVPAASGGGFSGTLVRELAGGHLRVPALRERAQDLPMMALSVAQARTEPSRPIVALSPSSADRLLAHPWAGNIAELEATVDRALRQSTGAVLEVRPRLTPLPTTDRAAGPLEDAIRRHILLALEQCDWRIEGDTGAAEVLGLAPSTLRSKMRRYGIRRSRW